MIKRVSATGWKCGNLDVELRDTNVVCGPNGSGKTSVLDSVRLCLFGEVPGLGKQNQAIMRGAKGRKVYTELEMDNGEVRTVQLERKGESVKKTASHEFIKPEVPLSVAELMSLSGDQFRKLVSFGDDLIDSADYVNDIAAEVPAHARGAVARCTVSGKGPVTSVTEWCRQIQDQVKRERSNLRESKGALANTQRLIAESSPVPAGIIQEWQDGVAEIKLKVTEKRKLLAECSENEAKARNSRRNLEAAKLDCEKLQHELAKAEGSIKELNEAAPPWTQEEIQSLNAQANQLFDEVSQKRESSAAPHMAVDFCLKAITRLEGLEGVGKCEETQQAINALNELAFRLPPGEPSDCKELEAKASQLQEEANRKAKELDQYQARLRQAGVTSIKHAEEVAKSLRLECAAASNRVSQLEGEVITYEGQSAEKLEQEIADLESQLDGLRRQIVNAEEYRNLVGAEASLQESIEKLEGELDDMKLVEKAAIKVQAKYLDGPVQKLAADLDEFSEAAGVDFKIRASFEKQGNTTTLAICLDRGSEVVPIESASGGEQIITGCAFLHAINKARKPVVPMIFVESAELDPENAAKLHAGLQVSAANGIQGFMTSFSSQWKDAIIVGQEASHVV